MDRVAVLVLHENYICFKKKGHVCFNVFPALLYIVNVDVIICSL